MNRFSMLLLLGLTALIPCPGYAAPQGKGELLPDSTRKMLAAGQEQNAARDRALFAPLAERIRRGASLNVYEGFPLPRTKDDMLQQRQDPDALLIADYAFHKRPRTVTDDEGKALRRLAAAEESYAFGIYAMCIFHPDYALAWTEEGKTYYLQICFTCHIARVIGPDTQVMLAIKREVFPQFEALLRKNRRQATSRTVRPLRSANR